MREWKPRLIRFIGIVLALTVLIGFLTFLDFVISLFFPFPGMIDLYEWLIGNPSTIPWAINILLLMIIGLEIFSE